MTVHTLGILLGLFGAFWQAANYAYTKDCQERYSLRGLRQLTAVHVLMFIIVLPPFLIGGHYRYFDGPALALMSAVIGPYLIAQYLMIRALASSDASVVSPLLTIKVPILAAIAFIFLDKDFTLQQYLAIAAIIALGWYFSSLGGRLRLGPFLFITGACTCFCLSDLAMTLFMAHLTALSRAEQILVGITAEYIGCGLLAVPAMFWLKVSASDTVHTFKVGLAWLFSMVGIVGCFNLSGVVEGNIIQTLRSVIGVIIAYLFYRRYIRDENTFRRKLGIAIAMFIAVTVYYL